MWLFDDDLDGVDCTIYIIESIFIRYEPRECHQCGMTSFLWCYWAVMHGLNGGRYLERIIANRLRNLTPFVLDRWINAIMLVVNSLSPFQQLSSIQINRFLVCIDCLSSSSASFHRPCFWYIETRLPMLSNVSRSSAPFSLFRRSMSCSVNFSALSQDSCSSRYCRPKSNTGK